MSFSTTGFTVSIQHFKKLVFTALKSTSRLQIVVSDSVRDAKCQVQMALLYLAAISGSSPACSDKLTAQHA